MTAPTMGPKKVWKPPSTVKKTILPEKVQCRMSGVVSPLSGTHSAPASPVKIPEIRKATQR